MYRLMLAMLVIGFMWSYPAAAEESVMFPEASYPIDIMTLPSESAAGVAAQSEAAMFVRLSTGATTTLAPGAGVTCTLYVRNTGTINWNNQYVLRSVNAAGTTPAASLLATNWRNGSTTDITVPTSNLIYAEGGPPNPANSVLLNWTAVGDDSLSGRASLYDVRYSTNAYSGTNWQYGTPFVTNLVPSDPGTTDTVRVTGLSSDRTYYFAIRTADERPNWANWSNVATVTTATSTARFVFQVRAPQAAGTFPLHLALYNGSGQNVTGRITTLNVSVATTAVAGAAFVPLVGRFNNDQHADIGLYQAEAGRWHVALNSLAAASISSQLPATSHWLNSWATGSGYTPLTGDFTGDGKTDIAVYYPTLGRWFVAASTGTRFQTINGPDMNGSWLNSWATGSGYTPLTSDFTGDGKTDIAVYYPTLGRWFVATSTGTGYQANSGYSVNGSWLDTWGRVTTTAPMFANMIHEESPEPRLAFTFHPIHPNPSRGRAVLSFTLPSDGLIELTVFDVQGRAIAHPIHGFVHAGRHSVDWHSRTQVPGMYFARLRSPFGDRVQRIILVP